ncbi:hypothetical protein PF003_g30076 [Phytophthora fragariae]|nr:hypothetical protein PF003_g30076 [Phytophthora fragariae]
MARVVSCRFLRLGCSEDEHPLFRREYARGNREKGVKVQLQGLSLAVCLLRCFPHCCPEHVKRSYCGCSMHLLVTFSADVTAALDQVAVATRFEPSQVAPLWTASLAGLFRDVGAAGDDDSCRHENERQLRVGEEVPLPESLFGSRAGGAFSKGAVWVQAERESDSMQRAYPKNTVLYAVNKRRFPEWFYNYDSSTTRTQRQMTHHLVAYVFHRSFPEPNQVHGRDPPTAVVLARHASPGFQLVSFRRSGATSSDACCELPAMETPVDNVSSGSPQVFDMSRAAQQQQQQHHHHYHQQRDIDSDPQWHRYPDARENSKCPSDHPPSNRSGRYAYENYEKGGEVEDASFGGRGLLRIGDDDPRSLQQETSCARELEFREKGQHLLILWKFVTCISLMDIGIGADTVGSYLMCVAAARSDAELERVAVSFLSDIFGRAHGSRGRSPLSTSTAAPSPAQERAVIRVAVRLFLRGLSSRTVKGLLSSFVRLGSDTGTNRKEKLQQHFSSLVVSLYDVLEDVLREVTRDDNDLTFGNQETCLPALVDVILSLVYTRDRFGVIRSEVSALLDWPEALSNGLDEMFQAFTAQVREFMIASATRMDLHQHTRAKSVHAVLHSRFSHRWVLDLQSVQVLSVESSQMRDTPQGFRVPDVAQLISEVGCIDIEIDTTAPRVSIRSVLSFASGATKTPTSLLLDGRLRVFRVLPSGLSSMIATAGGWSVGDYAGALADDAQSLSLDFFAFAEGYHPSTGGEIAVVRRVSLTLGQELEPMSTGGGDERELALVVHGVVYGSALRPDLGALNARAGGPTSTHRLFFVFELWYINVI